MRCQKLIVCVGTHRANLFSSAYSQTNPIYICTVKIHYNSLLLLRFYYYANKLKIIRNHGIIQNIFA